MTTLAEIDDLEGVPAKPAGDAFEDLCHGILRAKYGASELVWMPAAVQGDRGIEGFSTDGIAYQCYADRDSVNLRHRTDKQKQKLTTDTGKLKKFERDLTALFSGNQLQIRRYYLMVPQYHAAELQIHAAKRSVVVREFGLPFIANDFAIRIVTPEDFPGEMRRLALGGDIQIEIEPPELGPDAEKLFCDATPELVETLDRKLQHALPDHQTAHGLRDSLVRKYLQKEVVMASLEEWPDSWQQIERRRKQQEERLEVQNALSIDQPRQRVSDLIDAYKADLRQNVPALSEIDSDRIATGQVADWLMRCPLDFPHHG